MKAPIDGMEQTPFGPDYMAGAWYSLLLHAFTREDCRDSFKAETGSDISSIANASGLDAMIDEATGHQKQTIIKWADWVTANLWGVEG